MLCCDIFFAECGDISCLAMEYQNVLVLMIPNTAGSLASELCLKQILLENPRSMWQIVGSVTAIGKPNVPTFITFWIRIGV